MAHYKLILAYDGTNFNGFQRQAIKTSVQATFEEALRRLGWQGRAIMPSGRTDSGVHARGQVISFNLDWKHPDIDLQNALNAFLPADIAVQSVTQVAAEFHPATMRSAASIAISSTGNRRVTPCGTGSPGGWNASPTSCLCKQPRTTCLGARFHRFW